MRGTSGLGEVLSLNFHGSLGPKPLLGAPFDSSNELFLFGVAEISGCLVQGECVTVAVDVNEIWRVHAKRVSHLPRFWDCSASYSPARADSCVRHMTDRMSPPAQYKGDGPRDVTNPAQRRYFRTLYEAETDWPIPGPPSPRNNVWAVTDARDAAQAFRLAAEYIDSLHEVFFINGADTCSFEETPVLLSRHYPQVELKGSLEGHDSLISCQKAARVLKYRPAYSWRKSDFRDWVSSIAKVSDQ